MWKAKEPIVISDLEKAEKISKLIETLEDNEDAQNVYSNFEVADEIADLLKKHKGGFVLSYNDCSWIREAYKDFKIIEVSWQYTMGQGETRIGKNRLERDYDK